MKKYEVPLRVVKSKANIENLSVARKILDTLEREEMKEEVPIDNAKDFLESCLDIGKEDFTKELLDYDLEKRLEDIDEDEGEKIPKNYDVVLALASRGRLNDAENIMKFLMKIGKVKDYPLDVGVFEKYDEYEELADEMAHIISEFKKEDVKKSILDSGL